jgi:hypothetical protein
MLEQHDERLRQAAPVGMQQVPPSPGPLAAHTFAGAHAPEQQRPSSFPEAQ